MSGIESIDVPHHLPQQADEPIVVKPILEIAPFDISEFSLTSYLGVTLIDIGVPVVSVTSFSTLIVPPDGGSYRIAVVEADANDGEGVMSFNVLLTIDGISRWGSERMKESFDIARFSVTDTDHSKAALKRLESALQFEFNLKLAMLLSTRSGRALNNRGAGLALDPAGRGRFLSKKRVVIATVLVALALIAMGGYQTFVRPKDPLQQTLGSEDYSNLTAQIRQQMKQATSGDSGGNAFALKAQNNVSIDTLKAMGFDPGKANSGCLVGTK